MANFITTASVACSLAGGLFSTILTSLPIKCKAPCLPERTKRDLVYTAYSPWIGFAHITFSSNASAQPPPPASVAVIYDTSFLMSERAAILDNLVSRDDKDFVRLRHIVPSIIKAELANHLKNAESPEKQNYARKARALYALLLADQKL